MFALSTAWNSSKLEDGAEIAKEISNLGFKALELNFSLDQRLTEEIGKYCSRNRIAITSLHNFCPTPEGFSRHEALPDCYSLSSINEEERTSAVYFTKRSIKTAKTLGAKAVVLHSGRVEMEDKTRLLIEMHNKGQSQSNEYKNIFNSFVEERRLKAKKYLEQIFKSYEELIPCAENEGIFLGIENRFYYREIPSLEEFAIIFERFKNNVVRYWHDVGHAFILEKLGFMPHMSLLKNHADRLGGMHLHNIKNLADHQAPIEGDFDFKALKPYIKKDILKVIEVHKFAKPQAIKDSVSFLKELFGD